MTKVAISLGKPSRSCGDCTKCCEGWLVADIAGEKVYPGKPCSSLEQGVGCTIYKKRPKDPCKVFECTWLASDFVPERFSPKNTGQIIAAQRAGNIDFLAMAYAGEEVSSELLSWFVTFAVERQLNVEWVAGGQVYMLGSQEFIQARNAWRTAEDAKKQ